MREVKRTMVLVLMLVALFAFGITVMAAGGAGEQNNNTEADSTTGTDADAPDEGTTVDDGASETDAPDEGTTVDDGVSETDAPDESTTVDDGTPETDAPDGSTTGDDGASEADTPDGSTTGDDGASEADESDGSTVGGDGTPDADTYGVTDGDTGTDDTSESTDASAGFATDSVNKVVLEACDMSIPDVARLMDGQSPSEVTGNPELADYSLYSIYSVVATDSYEFDEDCQLSLKVKDITSDMDVRVMFLDEQGSWDKMSFEYNDGALTVSVSEEGQVAVFRHSDSLDKLGESADDNDSETDENAENDAEKTDEASPKTNDNIALFAAFMLLGAAGITISAGKLFKAR